MSDTAKARPDHATNTALQPGAATLFRTDSTYRRSCEYNSAVTPMFGGQMSSRRLVDGHLQVRK